MKCTAYFLMITLAAIVACKNNQQPSPSENFVAKDTIPVDTTAAPDISKLHFAVNKDLVCGMPLTAGVGDTAYYKGSIYGFCGSACKEDFVKDPSSYLTAR